MHSGGTYRDNPSEIIAPKSPRSFSSSRGPEKWPTQKLTFEQPLETQVRRLALSQIQVLSRWVFIFVRGCPYWANERAGLSLHMLHLSLILRTPFFLKECSSVEREPTVGFIQLRCNSHHNLGVLVHASRDEHTPEELLLSHGTIVRLRSGEEHVYDAGRRLKDSRPNFASLMKFLEG